MGKGYSVGLWCTWSTERSTNPHTRVLLWETPESAPVSSLAPDGKGRGNINASIVIARCSKRTLGLGGLIAQGESRSLLLEAMDERKENRSELTGSSPSERILRVPASTVSSLSKEATRGRVHRPLTEIKHGRSCRNDEGEVQPRTSSTERNGESNTRTSLPSPSGRQACDVASKRRMRSRNRHVYVRTGGARKGFKVKENNRNRHQFL